MTGAGTKVYKGGGGKVQRAGGGGVLLLLLSLLELPSISLFLCQLFSGLITGISGSCARWYLRESNPSRRGREGASLQGFPLDSNH